MSAEQLKPCPCCGSENTVKYKHGTICTVGCNRCDLLISRSEYDNAIAAWNRRAPAQQGGEVDKEALREAFEVEAKLCALSLWGRYVGDAAWLYSSEETQAAWIRWQTRHSLVYGDAVAVQTPPDGFPVAAWEAGMRPASAVVPPAGAVDGWVDQFEQLAMSKMGEAFEVREKKGRLADGALVYDDTQLGVEFVLSLLRTALAAAPTPPAADGVSLKDVVGSWLSGGGLVNPALLKLVNSGQQHPPAAEPVAWLHSRRYGFGLSFTKPVAPEPGDDFASDWICEPLYTHPPASPADASNGPFRSGICTPGDIIDGAGKVIAYAESRADRDMVIAALNRQASPADAPATDCAVCGLHQQTPLRVDRMGGYVCLPCIDDELQKSVADAVDADRYRFIRDANTDVSLVIDKRTAWTPPDDKFPGIGGYWNYEYRCGDDLDAAIDAAMAQGGGS